MENRSRTVKSVTKMFEKRSSITQLSEIIKIAAREKIKCPDDITRTPLRKRMLTTTPVPIRRP